MNVPSYSFLAFAVLAALVINISPAAWWRRTVFAVANVAFVLTFTHSPLEMAPFGALLVLGFAGAKLVERFKERALPTVTTVLIVAVFCWLKRYSFVPHEALLPFGYWIVGMSYVFFRILHLVIDAAQDVLPERIGPLNYLSYTLNFTCLVSGPIQLFGDYRRTEILEPLPLNAATLLGGLTRIITGFFKVSVLSTFLWYVFDNVVRSASATQPWEMRVLCAAAILTLFPIYLFFNFSGYTDFVIGAARFLRLDLPENFNRPFVATNFIEFWSRWHMTLSNWLKTYVYSPLLLNLMRRIPSPKTQPALGVVSYFVTFFLVGLWHGQSAEFLFFGVLQGAGVSAAKIYELVMTRRMGRAAYRALCAMSVYGGVSRGLTFAWFGFTLLWFWSSWTQLGQLAHALGLTAIASGIAFAILVSALILTGIAVLSEKAGQSAVFEDARVRPYLRVAWYTALATVVVSTTIVLNAPAPHVVYRGF